MAVPLDLTAKVFGRLLVLHVVEKLPGRTGQCWQCECLCGALVIRDTAQLMTARRKGHIPMCPVCLGQYRRLINHPLSLRPVPLGEQKGPKFREARLLDDYFWAPGDVLEELVETFGPVREEAFLATDVDPWFTDR